ncbi:hypothetical protein P3T24_006583 [Paraburkholderia sp. GAS33]|uniref:hypothetical protein n=1 Tax=Paraburkholderia sp. GAS33 TaxID=3035130 RepID=UPI003D248D9A
MAHTTEHGDAAKLKFRAVLDGHSMTTQQAARDVAELFASDIEGTLRERAPELASHDIHSLVLHVIERRLRMMLTMDESPAPQRRSLPVANLKPSEVIEQGKFRASLASLYRSVESNRFYCVVPAGQRNGREFPAWQFCEPVPELLQPVLVAFRGALKTGVHAFMVTTQDALNELAPAEMLAGAPFETRPSLHASQQRFLALPAMERQRKVLALAGADESMAD